MDGETTQQTATAGAAAAGWYPAAGDPPDLLRYWDGAQWTQHTSPVPAAVAPAPAAVVEPAPEQSPLPAMQEHPAPAEPAAAAPPTPVTTAEQTMQSVAEAAPTPQPVHAESLATAEQAMQAVAEAAPQHPPTAGEPTGAASQAMQAVAEAAPAAVDPAAAAAVPAPNPNASALADRLMAKRAAASAAAEAEAKARHEALIAQANQANAERAADAAELGSSATKRDLFAPTIPRGVPAAPGKRIGAAIIDRIIGTIAAIPFGVAGVMSVLRNVDLDDPNAAADAEQIATSGSFMLVGLAYIVLMFFYRVIADSVMGGTVGKMIMSINIVAVDDGTPVEPLQAVLRNLNYAIVPAFGLSAALALVGQGIGSIIGLASFVMLFVMPTHRTVMDMIAGTVVVDRK